MTTAVLPMFPLEMVAYQGELLSLHIFEERYQQLLKDCEESNITFGIPTYINNTLSYGTEMQVMQVVKRYPSGAADIICKGLRVFKLVDFYSTLGERLYAGGEVVYVPFEHNASLDLKKEFVKLLTTFYDLLDVKTPEVAVQTISAFRFAQKMGLDMQQQYELLQISSESDCFNYLIAHLKAAIPTLKSVNRTKELIKLNGHFKNFDPLDFKDYKLE
ncbi:LON peptidase substrate-binding domain-containing protein [Dokdonia sp. LLG6352-1]|uniref:LON peptidase substrate-binding domain-containing protein n=1 Tax=Dokdonia sp. LLG6352-1 TaxID=3160831 RepID=UPI00386D2D60